MTSKNKHLTLDVRPDLQQKTIALIQKSFAYMKNNRFDVDFYPLFNKENFNNIHILINEHDDVVATIGFLAKNLKYKNRSVPVGFLGGIAVEENLRGQGIFKGFFNDVLEKVETNVALLFLWSNLYEMYNKFDFHLAGEFFEYQANSIDPLKNAKKISDFSENEWDSIKKIYNENYNHYLTVVREDNDWKKIQKISSINGLIDNDSYYFFNKGQDLLNIVHEFGGKSLKELSNLPYIIWSPTKLQLSPEFKKVLGLIRIANKSKFLLFIDDFFEGKLKIDIMSKSEVKFTFEHKTYNEPLANFITLLFGPNSAEEFKAYLPPLFIGGADSI
ncbi:MAG: GNAT family N-acetyltransferase [Bacteriovoracaceae bacterium]